MIQLKYSNKQWKMLCLSWKLRLVVLVVLTTKFRLKFVQTVVLH